VDQWKLIGDARPFQKPPPRPSRPSGRTPTPTATRPAANRDAATDGTSLYSLHPNAAETTATTGAKEKTRRPTPGPAKTEEERVETTAVLRISTSQMKASARPPERYDMQSHRPPSCSASPTTGTTGLIHAASRRGTPRKRTRQPTQHL